MRYTIPGSLNDCARVTVRNRRMSRGEWRSIAWRGDLLNGLMGRDHLPPVHRERVRFGAWEERPSSGPSLRGEYNLYVHCSRIWAQNFHDAYEAARRIWAETPPALATLARSGSGVGMGEGPADSGGSESNKRGLGGIVSRKFADDAEWMEDR